MANFGTCFCDVASLQIVFFVVSFAVWNEALELDMNLTRHEITTFIGQPTNLGCYATATTLTNSSLTYSWTKDNHTVTQSPSVRAFGDVLVVTPEKLTDFGTYECNITNGVSSTQCRILLLRGLDKPGDESTTGCVNVSVLMPVLAVAVMSLLLFIHLLLQSTRGGIRRQNHASKSKRSEERSRQNQELAQGREASSVDEGIEMHVNGRASRRPQIETIHENHVTHF